MYFDDYSPLYLILSLIVSLVLRLGFWVVLGFLIFAFFRRRAARKHIAPQERYLMIALSSEDGFRQAYLLLAMGFVGGAALAVNNLTGDRLETRTIIGLCSALGLFLAYRLRATFVLCGSLIGLLLWWVSQSRAWGGDAIPGSLLLAGASLISILYFIIGNIHDSRPPERRFGLAYRVIGLVWVLGALFTFSTSIGLRLLETLVRGDLSRVSWPVAISFAALVPAIAVAAWHARKTRALLRNEVVAIVAVAALFLAIPAFIHPVNPQGTRPSDRSSVRYSQSAGLALAAPSYRYDTPTRHPSGLTDDSLLIGIGFNTVLFFALLGMILSGAARKERWLITLGTFAMALLVLVRYVDWFYEAVDKSVFFIGAGILLFIVGWLTERARRGLIAGDIRAFFRRGPSQSEKPMPYPPVPLTSLPETSAPKRKRAAKPAPTDTLPPSS